MQYTFNSAIENFKFKVRNPFHGTFLTSWLLINWKLWITAFFERGFEPGNKVEKMAEILGNDAVLYLVAYPLLATVVAMILFPALSSFLQLASTSVRNFIEAWGEKRKVVNYSDNGERITRMRRNYLKEIERLRALLQEQDERLARFNENRK